MLVIIYAYGSCIFRRNRIFFNEEGNASIRYNTPAISSVMGLPTSAFMEGTAVAVAQYKSTVCAVSGA